MEIIKLKDCHITGIDSDIDVYKARYYYESDELIQQIFITFSGDETVEFKFYDFTSCFGRVVGFFYGKDFSNVTKDKFIQMFVKEFRCDCSVYDTHQWQRAVSGDYDE